MGPQLRSLLICRVDVILFQRFHPEPWRMQSGLQSHVNERSAQHKRGIVAVRG